jgi:hypothetical protein
MVIEVKEKTSENIADLLTRLDGDRTRIQGKKTLADIFGKLKRGLDGLEYQKAVRYGDWD